MALITSPERAVNEIRSGACIGLGGSINAGHPMALIRALIRARDRINNLTVVGLTCGLDADLMVAGGAVSRLSIAYAGAEDIVGLPPAIRWAAEENRIEVWESEEGIHLTSLRARAQNLPYGTWTGALGTCCEKHPLVESTVDEESGMPYLKVRPLRVDVALLWAEAADEEGNVLMWGSDLGDEALRNAADIRIVQVERIVSTAVLSRDPDRVAPWSADFVVRAPLSTHPFTSSSLRVDEQWLRFYDETVGLARRAGERKLLDGFLDQWVDSMTGEDDYLTKIGVARLRELMI